MTAAETPGEKPGQHDTGQTWVFLCTGMRPAFRPHKINAEWVLMDDDDCIDGETPVEDCGYWFVHHEALPRMVALNVLMELEASDIYDFKFDLQTAIDNATQRHMEATC